MCACVSVSVSECLFLQKKKITQPKFIYMIGWLYRKFLLYTGVTTKNKNKNQTSMESTLNIRME